MLLNLAAKFSNSGGVADVSFIVVCRPFERSDCKGKGKVTWIYCRTMLCISAVYAVMRCDRVCACVCVCLSVCHVRGLCQNE